MKFFLGSFTLQFLINLHLAPSQKNMVLNYTRSIEKVLFVIGGEKEFEFDFFMRVSDGF